MQRICYLYTDFQRIVFRAALLEAGLDETEFRFITHGYCNDERLDSPTRIMGGFKKLEWSRARELIAEVNDAIEKCADGQSFELWLASDNSGIGQILIHHPLCKRVVLFEDGLANYGVHYPLLSKKNVQIELFRLRNLALLWPHYRMPKRAGECRRASIRYALTEKSFPYSDPEQVVCIARQHFLMSVRNEAKLPAPDNEWSLQSGDLLFIDAFKDRARANARRPLIIEMMKRIVDDYPVQRIVVRPHPGAQADFVSETVEQLGRALSISIDEVTGKGLFEVHLARIKESGFLIAGLMSTALLTARLLRPDSPVFCFGSGFYRKSFARRDGQLEALASMGVKVL